MTLSFTVITWLTHFDVQLPSRVSQKVYTSAKSSRGTVSLSALALPLAKNWNQDRKDSTEKSAYFSKKEKKTNTPKTST